MNPLVTIGLPYYNNAAHLGASICSVLSQSFTDWELLLVDDGSKDNSPQIARTFQDPRIRHISDRSNLGLACRLNQISAAAKGRFLFRMDGDDLMHPGRVSEQLKVLQGAPENTVVGTAAVEIDDAGRPLRILRSRGPRSGGYRARQAFLHPTVAAATTWFRSNPYSESPFFRRSQDAELWVRTAATSKFVNLDQPLLFYRWSPSLSFDKHLWQSLALIKLLSGPESGSTFLRVRCSCFELLKLQLRFVQALSSPGKASLKERVSTLTQREQDEYSAVIRQISGQ